MIEKRISSVTTSTAFAHTRLYKIENHVCHPQENTNSLSQLCCIYVRKCKVWQDEPEALYVSSYLKYAS